MHKYEVTHWMERTGTPFMTSLYTHRVRFCPRQNLQLDFNCAGA